MADKAQKRTPLIAGNWKMNLNHLEAIQLVQKFDFAHNNFTKWCMWNFIKI